MNLKLSAKLCIQLTLGGAMLIISSTSNIHIPSSCHQHSNFADSREDFFFFVEDSGLGLHFLGTIFSSTCIFSTKRVPRGTEREQGLRPFSG